MAGVRRRRNEPAAGANVRETACVLPSHAAPLDIKEESKHRLQAACALNGITLALVESADPVAGSLRVRMITGTAPLDSIRQHLSTLCTL